MNLQLKLIAWLLSVAIVFIVLFTAYKYGRHIEAIEQENVRNNAVIAATNAQLEEIAKSDIQKRNAEESHDKNQLAINDLFDALSRVSVPKAKRVCAIYTPRAEDSNGASGMAPPRVDYSLEEAKRDIDAIGKRCAQLNIDAIKFNELH